jgi:hypothetical protein
MIFGWSDFREFVNNLSSKMPRDAAPTDRQSDRRHAGKLVWVAMSGKPAIVKERIGLAMLQSFASAGISK